MEAVASLTMGFQRNCHQFGELGEDHLMLPESLQRRSPHSPPWATHVTAMQALLTVCLQVGNGNFHPIFQRLPGRLDYGTCHLLPPGWYTRSTLHSLAGDVAGCSALVIPLPQLDSELDRDQSISIFYIPRIHSQQGEHMASHILDRDEKEMERKGDLSSLFFST